jgi:hypothetical protein
MHDSTSEEDRRVLQEMVGRSGSPAFIRRAKLVETSWLTLVETCATARFERLQFVRLRMGQLRALAGGFDALRSYLPHASDLEFIQSLHDELQPRLRLPLEPTTSPRVLRNAANDLIEAIEMFNERWTRWLVKVDLTHVNQVREDYNKYYLFEKECAVGNAQVARMGFARLAPITARDLEARFPTLHVPTYSI